MPDLHERPESPAKTSGARRRLRPTRFGVVVTVTVLLVLGLCAALLLIPESGAPHSDSARSASADRAAATDSRVTEVRRTMEPFGEILARSALADNGRTSLVVGHDDHSAEMDTLAAELPAAVAAVESVWGTEWARSTLVAVASSPSEFAALLHSPTLPTEVAAASVADPFAPGMRPTGQRIVFSPDAGDRLDRDGMVTLLRHELTHIAARARTVDGAPMWMLEGFADYTAYHDRPRTFGSIAPTVASHIRAEDLPTDLPADALFTGHDAAFAYEQAWSVCAYVAATYGQPRLVEAYRRIAGSRQDAASLETALREVLGAGRDELVDGWRDWLATQQI
ncbi:hypothetical protein [Nocardia callitridis]|uniref:Peptidase MA-like domain-containing protein n=1 Tax=Nocardia callitridis TaxID=648753 RepID=A0ABP9KJL5_9NOCA